MTTSDFLVLLTTEPTCTEMLFLFLWQGKCSDAFGKLLSIWALIFHLRDKEVIIILWISKYIS